MVVSAARLSVLSPVRFWAAILLVAAGGGFVTGAVFMAPRPDRLIEGTRAVAVPRPETRDALDEPFIDPLALAEETGRLPPSKRSQPETAAEPVKRPPDPYADLLAFAPGEEAPVDAVPGVSRSPSPAAAQKPGVAEHEIDHRRAILSSGGGARPLIAMPMIAIVIDDLGIDRPHAAEVIDLPGPLTLSFMTYADDLAAQTARGRAHGHEIMLHVPMEPQARRVDPGPYALLTGLDAGELRRRLSWDLSRIGGIVGINNHMGSRFTESYEGMHLVMEMLQERHLFFLDSKTTPNSAGIPAAQAMGVPHAARDVFLDVTISTPAVAAELARTEAIARRTGFAIAIGHPHGATIGELRRWLPDLAARGFQLVPVSTIVSLTRDPGQP